MDRNFLVGFLDRNRFQIFGGSFTKPIALDIPQSTLRDDEVVNRVGLESQIRTWAQERKPDSAPMLLVLGEAIYFAKELTGDDLVKQEAETQAFIDTVPFEEVQIKHYQTATKHLVVAANKELLDIFQRTFGLVGIDVVSIVPEILLGDYSRSRWLDQAMGKYVVAQANTLLGQSLLEAKDVRSVARSQRPPKVAGINRLWLLLGIFILLIVMLVTLLLVR